VTYNWLALLLAEIFLIGVRLWRPRKKGRPKKHSGVPTAHEKVKNPETGRQIRTNILYFGKLAEKYGYNYSKNEILMHVPDPNNLIKSIVKMTKTLINI